MVLTFVPENLDACLTNYSVSGNDPLNYYTTCTFDFWYANKFCHILFQTAKKNLKLPKCVKTPSDKLCNYPFPPKQSQTCFF